MISRSAGEQVLIASNRGRVSFAVGDDGQLSAQRGGGGMVSGLGSVASHATVLGVCGALSRPDRMAARRAEGGALGLAASSEAVGVQLLDIPPVTFQRA